LRVAALEKLTDAESELPMALRHRLATLLDEITAHTQAMQQIDGDLAAFAERDLRCQRFRQATGVGLITATALSASIGELDRFPSGRHFASSLGLTPRTFQRRYTPARFTDATRRHLSAHSADPRRAQPAAIRQPTTPARTNPRPAQRLGATAVRAHRPQQGRLCRRQQAGPAAMGRRAPPHVVRP